jgi:energy-coupling factor transporter ATP-binding protein EcfA2
MSKSKILLLSSNPRQDLNLDREISDLSTAVQRLGTFEIRLGLGVRSQELPELLAEHNPQIVHFCGHGAGEKGLVFQDENGREQFVNTEILARIFKTFSEEINCTVLNACDSDRQAEAIVEHINYVVGMSQPILDKAAYHFSVGFYKGLAAGKSIEQAYELGCIAVQIWSATHAQSTQSRQYRKFESAEDVGQSPQPQLAEYLKPVLRKKPTLPPASLTSSSVPEVLPMSAPTEPTQAFVAYVQQEVDRKAYKDTARDAYDNFGQFSAQNAVVLTKSESDQRKVLLAKVKEFWIEGFLMPSLQGGVAIRLDRNGRPGAIAAQGSEGIEALSIELDASYDELQTTQIREEIGQGQTLLILGDPGSGKSIALLQLAQRLIDRSEQDLRLPLPVVFNLSSWAKDQKAIDDWLVDELREKYQVPKSLSQPWIKEQQLILLLDGLDEVKEDYRNDCVRALNDFIRSFPRTEVAVCSRVRDYEALSDRLQISSALCLKPFSSEQVYQCLDSIGGSLTGLKTLITNDPDLEKFAQNPLILNLMSVAYQGWSAEELLPQLRSASDRHHQVFEAYIDRRLERNASEYPKERVLRWLRWLASRMVQDKQTIFLIEKMQPTWLQNRSEQRAYRIKNFMIGALSVGLSVWLLFWLFVGLGLLFDQLTVDLANAPVTTGFETWISRWDLALIGGLSSGLVGGLMSGLSTEIQPLEKLSWSWQRAKFGLMHKLMTGFGYGLMLGLMFGLIAGLSGVYSAWEGELQDGWNFGMSIAPNLGLIVGLNFGLVSGLGSADIEQRVVPNQGIRKSRRNCLAIGLLTIPIIGLIVGLIGQPISELTSLLSNGRTIDDSDITWIGVLSVGAINGMQYGGIACIRHLNLCQILHKKGRIPQNYAHFLDFASDRLLMKKIGGGYVFFHRMVLEHFAESDRSKVSDPVAQPDRSTVPALVISESTSRSTAKSNPQINLHLNKADNNAIVCRNCDHANPIDGKFCNKCGKSLIQ